MKTSTRPLIISHRGNGNQFPENTIEACEKALQNGAEAFEVDIRYCAGGKMVVFHDSNLKRLLNKKRNIWSISLKELQTIEFPGLDKPVHVPSMETFLEHFKNTVPINLDLKTWWPLVGQYARDIVRIMKRMGNLDQLWVSSFNPVLLKTIKFNTARIRTGYLFHRLPGMHQLQDLIWKTDYWHPHISLINESFLERAENLKKELYVWTVNEEQELKKIENITLIRGLITDRSSAVASFFNL